MGEDIVYVRRENGVFEVVESLFKGEGVYGRVFSEERDGVSSVFYRSVKDPIMNNPKDVEKVLARSLRANVKDKGKLDGVMLEIALSEGENRAEERRCSFSGLID